MSVRRLGVARFVVLAQPPVGAAASCASGLGERVYRNLLINFGASLAEKGQAVDGHAPFLVALGANLHSLLVCGVEVAPEDCGVDLIGASVRTLAGQNEDEGEEG